ncbi:MAG: hypothetical protein AAF479_13015 [Pseudomonadota bacterium]
MTKQTTRPETLEDATLDQVQGAGASGADGQGDTTDETGGAAVLAWRTDYLSTKQTPVSAPDT